MNDVQRYRVNAEECLSAAERCEQPYRRPALAIAEAWLSLARNEEAMEELLAIWSKAGAPTPTASSPQSFILSTFTGPRPRFRSRAGTWRFRVGCDSPRPLCPYPAQARYAGPAGGDLSAAGNYACIVPK
jgi:hypothetical protein